MEYMWEEDGREDAKRARVAWSRWLSTGLPEDNITARAAANSLWKKVKRSNFNKSRFASLMDGVMITPEMLYDIWQGNIEEEDIENDK